MMHDLRRRLKRPGIDAAVVDDLVQQAALRLVRTVGAELGTEAWPEAKRKAYLRRVANSVWADHFRRRRPTEPLTRDPVQPSPEPQARLTTQVADWLPHLIEQLPRPYRALMREVELQGATQRALADRLGLAPSTVRTRVQRGRRRLRALLEACCGVTWEDEEVVAVDRCVDTPCGCDQTRR
ncbi:MAG: sigma-70 family RNA polymerase sigma factor [Myxococcota bacterium]